MNEKAPKCGKFRQPPKKSMNISSSYQTLSDSLAHTPTRETLPFVAQLLNHHQVRLVQSHNPTLKSQSSALVAPTQSSSIFTHHMTADDGQRENRVNYQENDHVAVGPRPLYSPTNPPSPAPSSVNLQKIRLNFQAQQSALKKEIFTRFKVVDDTTLQFDHLHFTSTITSFSVLIPMSDGEEGTPTNHPKPVSSVQAFYGGAAPATFYAATVASPTPLSYMWGSQHHFMPPYGTPMPYPALFPPEGIIVHSTVPSNPNLAPENGEFGSKFSDGKEILSTKKTKGASGSTSVLIGKGTKPSSSTDNGPNLSSESGVDGSSDASEQNTANHESAAGKIRNVHQMLEAGPSAQDNKALNPRYPVDTIPQTTDHWNAPPAGTRSALVQSYPSDSVAAGVLAMHDGVIPDQWVDGELKRQKRKQSNRESAKRSRLRKQAECQELKETIATLSKQNHIFKKELEKLAEECGKLTSENQSIKEELLRTRGPDYLSSLESDLQEAGADS